MSTYRFEALLTPRSVAVVGAGARAGSLGRAVFDKIRAGGFPGRAAASGREIALSMSLTLRVAAASEMATACG
ncbi:hypothetical protein FV225_28865, partial [Methylobacterium sp. WL93]|uniref:hypothetical protein n=1 Tax=Methylobacterium sp. WL93 TaxID=2603892 RepID=UPI0011C6FD77